MMKKGVPLWAVIIAVLATAGIVAAAILITWDVPHYLQVVEAQGMEVYWEDTNDTVTQIDWELLTPNDLKKSYELRCPIVIENTGLTTIYVGWNYTSSEPSITLELYERKNCSVSWHVLPQNDYSVISMEYGETWQIGYHIRTTSTAVGEYTVSSALYAADSSTG